MAIADRHLNENMAQDVPYTRPLIETWMRNYRELLIDESAAEDLLAAEVRCDINMAVAQMGVRLQRMFRLCCEGGMTVQEAALPLGMGEEQARSHYRMMVNLVCCWICE